MFLLDTIVISELRKIRRGTANAGVAEWADSVSAHELYLSSVTVEDIEWGILLASRRDAVQGLVLRAWLNQHVLPAFGDRILPVDTAVALCCAKLQVPDPLPYRDSLIAATALVHGMILVTRNTSDFVRSGAKLLNPWNDSGTLGAFGR